jgi:hypothetical protein
MEDASPEAKLEGRSRWRRARVEGQIWVQRSGWALLDKQESQGEDLIVFPLASPFFS